METLNTYPSNAKQTTAFISPALPSVSDGAAVRTIFRQEQGNGADPSDPVAKGISPVTPASMPDVAGQGVSGIVPTLQ